jgi:hypothetical protein
MPPLPPQLVELTLLLLLTPHPSDVEATEFLLPVQKTEKYNQQSQ